MTAPRGNKHLYTNEDFMKPRITLSVTDKGLLEILINESGRDLLVEGIPWMRDTQPTP